MKTSSDSTMASFFALKGYQLQHKIGQGGFGTVYLAINNNTGQYVAIKSVNLESQDQKDTQQIERFKRECHFVAKLDHPNIVRLLDKGKVSESNVYSIFEYVDGTNLSDYIQQHGALSIEEAYPIMLQILDALVHAHQQGIIHRDIKPSNIMLQQTGAKKNAKLLDFGISTITINQRSEDFKTITRVQESVGTPSYCAPEQLRGEPASFQSDLYMWGLVFIEVLTGYPAISGSSIADVYHQHLNDKPIAIPSSLLSHPLGYLLQKTLRKNINERIESAQALYDALEKTTISNLVGQFRPIKPTIHDDTSTLIQRDDDPNHIFKQYMPSTERKQITILALSLSLKKIHDAHDEQTELLESLYASTRQQCIDLAQRYGGFHVGSLGDLTLFYFGYPVASDHDSRLGARTSLEIISTITKQQGFILDKHHSQYIVKLGLHADILTQYGHQVPEGLANQRACHLSQQASDNSILCSDKAHSLLESYYEFDEVNGDISQSELIAERAIEAFGFIRGTRNNYPLIGRENELGKLRSFAKTADTPNALHIYGEAGIGKSRLLHEFRRFESKRKQRIFQCLPEHQNNSLYPILSFTKKQLDQTHNGALNKAEQLTSWLASASFTGPKNEITTLLAAWLGVSDLEGAHLSNNDMAIQKSYLFEGLAFLLHYFEYMYQASDSSLSSSIYIFEDIHWADTTTLEFIAYLAEQTSQSQQILTTSRTQQPDIFVPILFDTIKLEPLKQADTRAFIASLFDEANISPSLITLLETRADGIPLFLEELVSMLKRRRLVHVSNGLIALVNPEQIDDIPNTLRESIQNKIDSLVYAKDTLQIAAAIGRQFDYHLLVSSSDFSERQVQNDLSELIENQLIIPLRSVTGDSYLFKHALVRDAAYAGIDRQELPDIHSLIASSIINTQKTMDRFKAAQLANHFECAQLFNKASKWYYRAAKDAKRTFAISDAIHLYQSAQKSYCKATFDTEEDSHQENTIQEGQQDTILTELADCLQRDGQHEKARDTLQELILRLKQASDYEALANTLIALGKTYEVVHFHNDALANYEAAYNSLLKAPHSDTPEKSDWWKIWLEIKGAILNVFYWLGDIQKMKDVLEENESIILAIGDKEVLFDYYYNLFLFEMRKNRYKLKTEDLFYAEKTLTIAKSTKKNSLIARSQQILGLGKLQSNQYRESETYLKKALNYANRNQDKILKNRCLVYLSIFYRITNNIKEARRHSKESLLLSTEMNMNEYVAVAYANLAWSFFFEKNYFRFYFLLEKSIKKWDKIKTQTEYPFLWLSHLQFIILCGKSDTFFEKNINKVVSFSKLLRNKKQWPLPSSIDGLLHKIEHSKNKVDQIENIKTIEIIAKKTNLI